MKYDLAIIGGGPAGMMAAIQASEHGARVVLIEKNNTPGVKLLITGKDRCNITNNNNNLKDLVLQYGDKGKFLFSSLFAFGTKDAIDFFNELGVETKVERGERVFPVSDRSQDVLSVLLEKMKENKVEIKTNSAVRDIIKHNSKIEKIILFNGGEIVADKFIVATGGKSYPATGSTGDGYLWLKKMGHTIVKPRPVLTPIICKEKFIKKLEGLSLKNVEIKLFKHNISYSANKEIASEFGEAIFTSRGMSGPIILNLSKFIIEDSDDKYELTIDFKPTLDIEQTDKRIIRDFQEFNNKQFRNSLGKLLPKKLIPIIVKISKIDPDKQVNLITKEERGRLLKLLKNFKLKVFALVGFEKAIITSGGVDLKEVDPKTCKSKIIDNLYLAGEILDLDGPTGGYNLQVCWSTGFVAGKSAGK
jgi:predicted Rossmann fold flavoprotein